MAVLLCSYRVPDTILEPGVISLTPHLAGASTQPLCTPTPASWQCPEPQVPRPRQKCPAALWLRAGVILRLVMHDSKRWGLAKIPNPAHDLGFMQTCSLFCCCLQARRFLSLQVDIVFCLCAAYGVSSPGGFIATATKSDRSNQVFSVIVD